MPGSSNCGKRYLDLVLRTLHQTRPFGLILDVGVGAGTYRQLLADLAPEPAWFGVEVWAPYVERYHLRRLYHHLLLADIRSLDPERLPHCDLVIFGDVLEHMAKEEAQAVVTRWLKRSRLLVISLPIVKAPQGAAEGNPYECHVKDDWSHQEVFASFPGICAVFLHSWIGAYLLTEDPACFVDVRRHQPLVAQQVRRELPQDFILWA